MTFNYQPDKHQKFEKAKFCHKYMRDLDARLHTAIPCSLLARLFNFIRSPHHIKSSDPLIDSFSVSDQDTLLLRSIDASSHPFHQQITDGEPGFIQRIKDIVQTRWKDPQPEGLLTRGLQTVIPETRLGATPALTLTMAFGLLSISLAYYLSVEHVAYELLELAFLGGLLLIFVPVLVRLLSRTPSRLERICLLCILSIFFFLVQFMGSPLHFSEYDESLHWRTANDILNLGHLFTTNTMLPVSPYYPGLEIVTNAISTTTGLNTFYGGNVIIVAAHILIVLASFLLYEKITNSSRMASIAVVIYTINSHFLFFDAFYSYETLALPFAVFMFYTLTRYDDNGKDYRWVKASSWIVLIAMQATHHMTSYVFDGLLVLWTIVSLFNKSSRNTRIYLVIFTLFSIFMSLAYAFLIPGNPVWSYLFQFFSSTFHQLGQIVAGTSKTRPLFSSAGRSAPIWDRLLMTASVVIVTFSLPFGLLFIKKQHSSNILAVTLGIISLLYPITQAFRFTQFGAQITDRASAFLFLSVAYVLTVLIAHSWPTRQINRSVVAFLTVVLAIVFLGGVIVEAGPGLSVVPGPYVAEADARSIEYQGIDAALWSLAYLGPNNHIATDRVNQMLMNTYGNQHVVTYLYDKVDVSPIFYSTMFNSSSMSIIYINKIHYIETDLRISTVLPLQETYFEIDRPTQMISRNAITKFSDIRQLDRLFDSGDIVIYDTEAFLHDPRT